MEEEPSSAALSLYAEHFQAHVDRYHSHPLGAITEGRAQYGKTRTASLGPSPQTSVSWSAHEKDVFFASLARNSRWRPDLIAAEVESKSETQVAWYLECLESGSNANLRQRRSSSINNEAEGWLSGMAPAALEMPEEWIAKEESLASALHRQHEQLVASAKHELRDTIRSRATRLNFPAEDRARVLGAGRKRKDRMAERAKILEERLVDMPRRVNQAKEQELRWTIEDYLAELNLEQMRLIGEVQDSTEGLQEPLVWAGYEMDPVVLTIGHSDAMILDQKEPQLDIDTLHPSNPAPRSEISCSVNVSTSEQEQSTSEQEQRVRDGRSFESQASANDRDDPLMAAETSELASRLRRIPSRGQKRKRPDGAAASEGLDGVTPLAGPKPSPRELATVVQIEARRVLEEKQAGDPLSLTPEEKTELKRLQDLARRRDKRKRRLSALQPETNWAEQRATRLEAKRIQRRNEIEAYEAKRLQEGDELTTPEWKELKRLRARQTAQEKFAAAKRPAVVEPLEEAIPKEVTKREQQKLARDQRIEELEGKRLNSGDWLTQEEVNELKLLLKKANAAAARATKRAQRSAHASSSAMADQSECANGQEGNKSEGQPLGFLKLRHLRFPCQEDQHAAEDSIAAEDAEQRASSAEVESLRIRGGGRGKDRALPSALARAASGRWRKTAAIISMGVFGSGKGNFNIGEPEARPPEVSLRKQSHLRTRLRAMTRETRAEVENYRDTVTKVSADFAMERPKGIGRTGRPAKVDIGSYPSEIIDQLAGMGLDLFDFSKIAGMSDQHQVNAQTLRLFRAQLEVYLASLLQRAVFLAQAECPGIAGPLRLDSLVIKRAQNHLGIALALDSDKLSILADRTDYIETQAQRRGERELCIALRAGSFAGVETPRNEAGVDIGDVAEMNVDVAQDAAACLLEVRQEIWDAADAQRALHGLAEISRGRRDDLARSGAYADVWPYQTPLMARQKESLARRALSVAAPSSSNASAKCDDKDSPELKDPDGSGSLQDQTFSDGEADINMVDAGDRSGDLELEQVSAFHACRKVAETLRKGTRLRILGSVRPNLHLPALELQSQSRPLSTMYVAEDRDEDGVHPAYTALDETDEEKSPHEKGDVNFEDIENESSLTDDVGTE